MTMVDRLFLTDGSSFGRIMLRHAELLVNHLDSHSGHSLNVGNCLDFKSMVQDKLDLLLKQLSSRI